MIFKRIFSPKCVIMDIESEEKDELFEEMVEALHSVRPDFDREEALASIRERESKMTTGIMHSVAVPHGTSKSVKGCVGAIGISRKGIDYESLDGSPVHFVFLIVCGEGEDELHLEVLKDLAVVLQDKDFIPRLQQLETPQEVCEFLCRAEE